MKISTVWNKTAAVLLAAGLAVAPVWASGIQKLGFINTERVYQESKQAQTMMKALESEFTPSRTALLKLENEGIALQNKISKAKPGPKRDRDMEKLAELSRRFRLEEMRLAEEYNLRRNEEFAALQHKANQALLAVAKRGGYDLILSEVLFIDSKFDITDEVLREMNR